MRSHSYTFGQAPVHRPGMAPAIGISLALHLLLILGYRVNAPEPPADLPPKRTMTVWLLAPKPAPVVPAAPAPATSAATVAPLPGRNATRTAGRSITPVPSDEEPRRQREHTAPRDVTATAWSALAPAAAVNSAIVSNASSSEQPPAPAADYDPLRAEPAPKAFDMEAARREARKVAVEKPAPGTLAANLQAHPLYPEDKETQLAKDVKGAGRADCLKQAGNLLTPLFWLLDKKDHGCKF